MDPIGGRFCNPSSHSSSASQHAPHDSPSPRNTIYKCQERLPLTHFFLAGFRRAEGSFGAEEEDAAAAETDLGGAFAGAADVFAVEVEFAALGPSTALEPEDKAGFCKEVTISSHVRGLLKTSPSIPKCSRRQDTALEQLNHPNPNP